MVLRDGGDRMGYLRDSRFGGRDLEALLLANGGKTDAGGYGS